MQVDNVPRASDIEFHGFWVKGFALVVEGHGAVVATFVMGGVSAEDAASYQLELLVLQNKGLVLFVSVAFLEFVERYFYFVRML